MDGNCYQAKTAARIDREVAANPELVQIENAWRHPKQQRPGAVQRGHFREIVPVTENTDAESASPCAAAKAAIVVYGKRIGTTLTVCTDNHCQVHDPRAAKHSASTPAPTRETKTEVDAQAHKEEVFQQPDDPYADQEAERTRRMEERREEFARQQKEDDAEQAKREELQKTRTATFDRILRMLPPPSQPRSCGWCSAPL